MKKSYNNFVWRQGVRSTLMATAMTLGMTMGMTMGAMGFGTTTAAAQTTKAPDSSNMSENAVEWNKGVTMGWNLGNYFECDGTGATWYTNWGNPKTTQAMIKAVKAAGFDAIRIPVRWGEKFDNTNQTVDSKELDMVQEVVDWCLAEDMKVVINTHHEKPWLETNVNYANKEANLKKLSAIWTAIATRFCDYDGRLAFAGVNEVLVNWSDAPTTENNEVLNSYHQTFVDAVRATGGRNYYRNLVVQTYACNPSYGLSGLEIPTDVVEGRLTVEFHYYQPWSYCGGENGAYYWWGNAYSSYGSVPSENEETIRLLFNRVKKEWMDKGLGVMIGEYGVSNHYDASASSETQAKQKENMGYWMQFMTEECRKRGFSAFVWDNNAQGNGNEKFGLFDRNNSMSTVYSYILDGIKKGSVATYDPDYGKTEAGQDYVSRDVWSGSGVLNWGEGAQIKIAASEFANFSTESKIILTYSFDGSASYTNIQFCDQSWSGMTLSSTDGAFTGSDFDPASHDLTPGTYTTAFAVGQETVTKLKSGGLILQGYGVTLTKVALSDSGKTTAIRVVGTDQENNRAWGLDGRQIDPRNAKGIVIQKGKRSLKR